MFNTLVYFINYFKKTWLNLQIGNRRGKQRLDNNLSTTVQIVKNLSQEKISWNNVWKVKIMNKYYVSWTCLFYDLKLLIWDTGLFPLFNNLMMGNFRCKCKCKFECYDTWVAHLQLIFENMFFLYFILKNMFI